MQLLQNKQTKINIFLMCFIFFLINERIFLETVMDRVENRLPNAVKKQKEENDVVTLPF